MNNAMNFDGYYDDNNACYLSDKTYSILCPYSLVTIHLSNRRSFQFFNQFNNHQEWVKKRFISALWSLAMSTLASQRPLVISFTSLEVLTSV
ncbi:hypothetical protein QVD17_11325 [Tagetes erecta]|uniref:Uncharacterized protein n=1 Tax=Tagetes erecta TaxID=13708 RepID=A0AAD8P0R2_TARER|nr:hypothetical protein QVD17_11325 [Tagetes erecta]